MKKIYMVTSGNYSDYGIDAVFDSKELAQKFIDKFGNRAFQSMGIEEWELNKHEKQIRNGFSTYFIRMDKEGNSKEAAESNNYEEYTSFDIKDNMYCIVYAKDIAHAVKIANEKRVQFLSTNSWGKS